MSSGVGCWFASGVGCIAGVEFVVTGFRAILAVPCVSIAMLAGLYPDPLMPHNIKRIGVLTGGGDCPGLNAVIRAVTKTAIWKYGIEVVGIEDGFQGLIEDRVRPLSALDVSGILTRGGTILGSNNRCNPRKYCVRVDPVTGPVFEDVIGRCEATARRHALDAIIVIGGDGTMAAAAPLVEAGQVRFARKADSLIEELLAFSPRGGVDDQVDAFCQGVLWIEAQYWRGRGHSSAPLPMVFSR